MKKIEPNCNCAYCVTQRIKQESIENLNMKLAAISTASFQNTEESIKNRLDKSSPYCTTAYMDVCAAVDREMKWRSKYNELLAEVKKLATPLIDKPPEVVSEPSNVIPLPSKTEKKSSINKIELQNLIIDYVLGNINTIVFTVAERVWIINQIKYLNEGGYPFDFRWASLSDKSLCKEYVNAMKIFCEDKGVA